MGSSPNGRSPYCSAAALVTSSGPNVFLFSDILSSQNVNFISFDKHFGRMLSQDIIGVVHYIETGA